ncbi:MAG: hypothetical protein OWQ48_03505 [Desulfurococcus sp.]|nr:hypothetical protein [Desulfurococcus sp.]
MVYKGARGGSSWMVIVLLALSFTTWFISFQLHSPSPLEPFTRVESALGWGVRYSDIVYGVFYSVFQSGERWFNSTVFYEFTSGSLKYPLPYVHYRFEYPPVVGGFWALSTNIALAATSSIGEAGYVHYVITSIILLAFTITSSLCLRDFLKEAGGEGYALLYPLLPSMIFYLVYNWDIIAAGFALLGLYYLRRNRLFAGGVLLGLSFSSKLLTAGLAFYYLVKLYASRAGVRRLLEYTAGFTATGLLPFMLVAAASPEGLASFIAHHSGWYCENCIYMAFTSDIRSPLHKLLYVAAGGLLFLTVGYMQLKHGAPSVKAEIEYFYLYLTIPIVFSYVFPPQFLVMLTPMALIVSSYYKRVGAAYLLAEVLNAALIIVFFKELAAGGNPWILHYNSSVSLTQTIAMARNIILLVVTIDVLVMLAGESRGCCK